MPVACWVYSCELKEPFIIVFSSRKVKPGVLITIYISNWKVNWVTFPVFKNLEYPQIFMSVSKIIS